MHLLCFRSFLVSLYYCCTTSYREGVVHVTTSYSRLLYLRPRGTTWLITGMIVRVLQVWSTCSHHACCTLTVTRCRTPSIRRSRTLKTVVPATCRTWYRDCELTTSASTVAS